MMPIIWGYSIHQGVAAFRTLGRRLEDWIEEEDADSGGILFWDGKEGMLRYLDGLLTPRHLVEQPTKGVDVTR